MFTRVFVLALLAGVSSASAADIAKPMAAAARGYDWSGLYAGVHAGVSWSANRYAHVETAGVGGAALNSETFSTNPASLAGGLQIGILKQYDRFVVGAEANYTFRGGDTARRTDLNGFPRDRITTNHDYWSVAARLGYAVDRFLGYGKIGYAQTEVEYTNRRRDTGAVLGESKNTVGGVLLGAGLEYAVLDNLTIAGEYSWAHFGVGNQQQERGGVAVAAYNGSNTFDAHTLSLRVNYKLDLWK